MAESEQHKPRPLIWWCQRCMIEIEDPGYGHLPRCPKCLATDAVVKKEDR